MARHAPSCAGVGAEKAPENQPRVAGENDASELPAMSPIVHPATDNVAEWRQRNGGGTDGGGRRVGVDSVDPGRGRGARWCGGAEAGVVGGSDGGAEGGAVPGPDGGAEAGRERARHWSCPDLPGVDLLRARCVRGTFRLDEGHIPARAAAEVGISDQSHLTRHFSRIVGVPPGAYRQERLAAARTYKTGAGPRP
jgi:hypothetical protein